MKLKIDDPGNEYLNYKIGSCYLHIPFRHERAIPYLLKACGNIDPKAKNGSFKEKKAPPEALFNLANAYRINNQLDKAIETYLKFKDIADPEKYDSKLIDEQIRSCENAKQLMKEPVVYREYNLGPVINTRFSETNPVVSADGKTLVFVAKLQFYDALFFSKMKDGEWSKPVNLIPYLGVDGDVYPTSLSADGTEMFLYRNDGYIGNIYESKYYDEEWHPITKLNDNINTKYWESHACISNDGRRLYFTSNRKGGLGGLDIYVSEKDAEGNWGPARNLGPIINTPENEETPFITENGQRLYFSSYGHYNIGGYDIFYSVKSDTGWKTPVNLGYPVNTTDDDLFFMPVNNGAGGYFATFGEDTYGQTDLYYFDIYSDINPRKFRVKGTITAASDTVRNQPAEIFLISNNGDTVYRVAIPAGEKDYAFDATEGNYSVLIKANGFREGSQQIDLKRNLPFEPVSLDFNLSPDPAVQLADAKKDPQITPEIIIPKISLKPIPGEDVSVPLQFNTPGMLRVEQYVGGRLISDKVEKVTSGHFDYRYRAAKWNTLLKFTLTAADGNTTTASVNISVNTRQVEDKKHISTVKAEIPDSANVAEKYTAPEDTDHIASKETAKDIVSETGFISEKDTYSHISNYRIWLTMAVSLFAVFLLLLFFYRKRKNEED
jgi:hypothetical protein